MLFKIKIFNEIRKNFLKLGIIQRVNVQLKYIL